MYNLASKLLAPLFEPLTLAILLAAAGLLAWKHRRLAVRLLLASVAILLIFSSWIPADALVASLENQNPDPGDNLPPAQAIVILGGTLREPSGLHHSSGLIDASDRLLRAFRLYRAGRAPLLFCSGGRNPIASPAGQLPEATWMVRLLEEWGVPPAAIEAEGGSIDTHQNAIMTYKALAPRGIRHILLVTSAMHMPRAAGAFRKAGFDVVPAPADFHAGWQGSPLLRWFPSPDNLVRSSAALHEWLGILVYRARGWL